MNFFSLTQDIEDDWKKYFRWSIVYPTIAFLIVFILLFIVIGLSFTNLNHTIGIILSFILVVLVLPIGFLMIVYMLWFGFASHQWFKKLGFNLLLSNFINIMLLLSGLHFCTVFYLHLKIKEIRKMNQV